jgi:hypothetical protein
MPTLMGSPLDRERLDHPFPAAETGAWRQLPQRPMHSCKCLGDASRTAVEAAVSLFFSWWPAAGSAELVCRCFLELAPRQEG